MAKKPVKPTSGPRASQSERAHPSSAPADPAAGTAGASEIDELEGDLSVSTSELDELESRLNARLAEAELPVEPDREQDEPSDRQVPAAPIEPEPRASAPRPARRTADPEPDREVSAEAATAPEPSTPGGRRASAGRGFGSAEWAALGGFGLLTLIAGALFLKFLYGHSAPIQGKGLPGAFELPLAGSGIRLSGAEASWRARAEGDKAQADEVMVPTLTLTLDPGHASKGFVRVEFVDSDEKIRGDVLTVTVEGGRFKDSGRGEIIEEGGLKVRLAGTVGFRSHSLFTSYLAGDETRWSVHLKEGPDYSNGPWTALGAALIPNTKH
jgi:hypothetical protein